MTWISRVVCDHHAVLGRAPTVDAWPPHAAAEATCTHAEHVGGWTVGIAAPTEEARSHVRDAVASVSEDDLPLASAAGRLTRLGLPECSLLLSDGEYAAGIAWGRPLGLGEIGAWEYALTSTPLPGHPWTPLALGTIAFLDSCGPTLFRLPVPELHPTETLERS